MKACSVSVPHAGSKIGSIVVANADTPTIDYRAETIADGVLTEQAHKLRGVRRRLLSAAPASLSPLFMLTDGENLLTAGFHHNFEVVDQRYANLLATAPRQKVEFDIGPDARAFIVGGAPNFYHFVTNYLARIFYYDVDGGISEDDKFLVAEGLPDNFYVYLDLLGIKRSQLILAPPNAYLDVPQAIGASLPHYFFTGGLRGDRAAFDWLRNKLRCERGAPLTRRLMLSRRHMPHRRILNEDELFNVALRYGFERICPEDYGVADLLDLLSEAEILVSPYGAGMTNSLFCSSQCTVVEIVGRGSAGKLNSIVLCALAGQRCLRVVAEEDDLRVKWAYRNLILPPVDFEIALKAAIGDA